MEILIITGLFLTQSAFVLYLVFRQLREEREERKRMYSEFADRVSTGGDLGMYQYLSQNSAEGHMDEPVTVEELEPESAEPELNIEEETENFAQKIYPSAMGFDAEIDMQDDEAQIAKIHELLGTTKEV